MIFKIVKDEKGQVAVLVVFLFIVLCGFVGLAIDVANLLYNKNQLQNSVDFAALSAAQKTVESHEKVVETATDIASKNDIPSGNLTVTHPYGGDDYKVKVAASRSVKLFFLPVLGIADKEVSASAVAKKNDAQWSGDLLPFLNQDNYTGWALDTEFYVWSKVDGNGGDKESIYSFEIEYSPSDSSKSYPYTKVDYTAPIELKNGFANGQKDSDGDKKKDAIDKIIKNDNIGKTFYVLSLSEENFTMGKVWAQDKGKGSYEYKNITELTNKDFVAPIDPNTEKPQFVLLEGTLVSFDSSNQHNIKLKFKRVYKILEGDIPTDYVYPDGSGDGVNLIE